MASLILFLKTNILHVAPILAIAAFAVAIVLERTQALMWVYPMTNLSGFFDKIRDLIMGDRLADAIALCDRYRSKPAAQIVREALLRAHLPESMIEDGLQITVNDATQKVYKRTQFLSTVANVATLLGLFGTIVGLVHSFEAVGSASAQERSSLLAAGISTAMNATMCGLGVAIPCMLAFSFLMNKTNRLVSEFDQVAVRIMDVIRQRSYSAEVEASGQRKTGGPYEKTA